jgi:hypothetical protein
MPIDVWEWHLALGETIEQAKDRAISCASQVQVLL